MVTTAADLSNPAAVGGADVAAVVVVSKRCGCPRCCMCSRKDNSSSTMTMSRRRSRTTMTSDVAVLSSFSGDGALYILR